MNEDGLKPCPHCIQSQVELDKDDTGLWKVICGACGSSSGISPNKDVIVTSWNDRPWDKTPSEVKIKLRHIKDFLHRVAYGKDPIEAVRWGADVLNREFFK